MVILGAMDDNERDGKALREWFPVHGSPENEDPEKSPYWYEPIGAIHCGYAGCCGWYGAYAETDECLQEAMWEAQKEGEADEVRAIVREMQRRRLPIWVSRMRIS